MSSTSLAALKPVMSRHSSFPARRCLNTASSKVKRAPLMCTHAVYLRALLALAEVRRSIRCIYVREGARVLAQRVKTFNPRPGG